MGNTLTHGPHYERLKSKGLQTLRLGEVAYDVHGKPLAKSEGYSPLFINRSEADLHNEIMMELTFGQNWRRG
ncbi:hypothetical protein [Aureimonas altamirensis]|uniref:hypothetical protein n=1 Tax=Aureimonas altamirensis TaxID=370622 RepID=UPI0012E0A2D0|nr:hypothetical protein [Aureimonas altamirensis]